MSALPPVHTSSKQSSRASAPRIDAHHHLWRFRAAEFAWIDDAMAPLRRNFLVDELCREMQTASIDAAVAVQARQSLEETRWLLDCAHASPAIRGVVGWAPLEAENLSEVLDRFADRKLVGFREIVQGKPAGYFDRPEFNCGISQLTSRRWSYDILIHERQLEEATRFVDRHPHQRFVLDHAAKPNISTNEIDPWKTNLLALARRPNVYCKISGLVTEAPWHDWTPHMLRPYLDICVAAFGTNRILAGSDWPVCLLASTYSKWWNVLATSFADFSETEVSRVFGENAIEAYLLPCDA